MFTLLNEAFDGRTVYVTHQFYRREEIPRVSECDHKIGYEMERKDKKEIYIILFARNMWDITKLLIKRN